LSEMSSPPMKMLKTPENTRYDPVCPHAPRKFSRKRGPHSSPSVPVTESKPKISFLEEFFLVYTEEAYGGKRKRLFCSREEAEEYKSQLIEETDVNVEVLIGRFYL
jgi:hypothetical protein